VIDPRAIKDFLNRPLDSHVWLKKISERKLDAALADQGFKPARADPPLRKHQKVCILLGLAYPQFAFWLDMGTGKTRITLELLRHAWLHEKLNRALILIPSEEGVYSWEKQIRQWQIDIPFIALGNSASEEKWRQLDEFENGLILATYPGLSWMLSVKKAVKGKSGKTKVKMKRSEKLSARIMENLDAIVLDESTKVGNHQSLTYKLCRKISSECHWRYALAGRPFGRDPTMIWSQQFLIDRGETLGETLGLFRAAFFREKKAWFGGFDYIFDKRMEETLSDIMQHRSISYSSDECQTLPKVTRIVEKVRLPEDVEVYYQKAVDQIIAARGNRAIIKNAFLRMRQLSSGFLGFKDDETGERAQLVFPRNYKLDRMLELIEAIPLDRKFVIFHEFTHSGRMICDALTKMKIRHGWLWGGQKESRKVQEQFDNDDRTRGLVVNHKLGAMVLNLQVANYELVYESPLSSIDRDQMDKRLFREGQVRPGFIIDMVVRDTVDQGILDNHAEGGNLYDALLRNPQAIVGKTGGLRRG